MTQQHPAFPSVADATEAVLVDAGSGVVEDAWPELTDEEWLTRFADAEFDSQLSSLTAGHGFGQREVDEARACLDALLETRAFIASLQAKELRLLARLEELALAEPGKHAPSREREMALRSMAAEVALARPSRRGQCRRR